MNQYQFNKIYYGFRQKYRSESRPKIVYKTTERLKTGSNPQNESTTIQWDIFCVKIVSWWIVFKFKPSDKTPLFGIKKIQHENILKH